jgi:hypothetical protein
VSDAAPGKGRKAEMTDSKSPEQRNTTRVVIIPVVCLVVYVLLGVVLWMFLNSYVDPTAIEDSSKKATAKKDLIQAWGFIMAGVAGAVGIFFTWRNLSQSQASLRLNRETQEQNQQNAQEELRLTRQGQMTERFTQAIEQLGSDKLEIKLGGIYSLERTAQEEKNYHWPVMEVLTSYVRRHAPRKPDKESMEKATTPGHDIQDGLDVIGRRSEDHRIRKEVEYGTIELNNTDLQGADLRRAKLQEAALYRADLQRASLQGANLQRAYLYGANLQEAALYGANLQGANLQGAELREANLQGAELQEANLQRAHLEGADLREADLREANLKEAYLQGADLRGAHGLTEELIEWTMGSNETNLPEGLNRPELWSKSRDEQYRIILDHIVRG